MQGKSIWTKGVDVKQARRQRVSVEKPLTIEDWIPGGVLIVEPESPGEVMNSRRQTLTWDGVVRSGIRCNTNTPADVCAEILRRCVELEKAQIC